MRLIKQYKYQKGFYYIYQLYKGSATPIYIVLYLNEFIVAYTTYLEAKEYILKQK